MKIKEIAILILVSFLVIASIFSIYEYIVINKEERILMNIEDIHTNVSGKKVSIDFVLRGPVTCQEILDTLEINTIQINRINYAPACQKINDKLIRVVYSEVLIV
jgi:hypothetical protein